MQDNWNVEERIPIKKAKKVLLESYEIAWQYDVKQKSKLSMYRRIKTEWGSLHATSKLPKSKRSLMSQFRLGILGLQVELGRYTATVRHERICNLCNTECEDEYHFIFRCNKLENIHQDLYDREDYLYSLNEKEKITELTKRPYVFANFLYKMWQARSKLIF